MYLWRAPIHRILRSRWFFRTIAVMSAFGLLLGPGCKADSGEGRDATPSASTAVSSVPASERPNPLQSKVVTALSTLGIRAAPAELSLNSAQIAAQFGDGSELIVNALPIGIDGSMFSVRDERSIESVVVRTVYYPSSDEIRHRFECGSAIYEAYGAVPPSFDSFDEFLARFITALGCT